MNSQDPADSKFSNSESVKLFLGVFLLTIPYLIMASLGPVEAQVPVLLACLTLVFTVYWFACIEGKLKLSSLQVLVLGLLMRVILIPMPACDDMYRYLWEGKILNLGFSPFKLSPDAAGLVTFQDVNWPLINHPNLPTLYPIIENLGLSLVFQNSLHRI
jgi:hypothetical protein